MIGYIDININAERPELPIAPIYAYVGSPSSFRVVGVPKAVGSWRISKVYVTVNYPDNSSASKECTPTDGCFVATVPASASVGVSHNGITITADGVDEAGNVVTGYVLGKGDVEILSTDGTITVGETTYYIHLLDSVPATPHKGDLCKITGVWKLYNGTQWETLGGGGGGIEEYASREEFPATGTAGMLYLAKNTNKLYRWATELSPATYAEVSPQTAVAWGDVTGKPESFPPSAHKNSHKTNGSDPITPTDIGAIPATRNAINKKYTITDTNRIEGKVTSGSDNITWNVGYTAQMGFVFYGATDDSIVLTYCDKGSTKWNFAQGTNSPDVISGVLIDGSNILTGKTLAQHWTSDHGAITTGTLFFDEVTSGGTTSYKLFKATADIAASAAHTDANSVEVTLKSLLDAKIDYPSTEGINSDRILKRASNGTLSWAADLRNKLNSVALAPDYDANTTYAAGAFVSYFSKTYVSLRGDNTGHTPVGGSGDTWWALADLSYLFSGANSSLTNTIDSKISAKVQNLDPDTASLADLINALKGNN